MTDPSLAAYLAEVQRHHIAHGNRFGCWHRTMSRRRDDPGVLAWVAYKPGAVVESGVVTRLYEEIGRRDLVYQGHYHGHGGLMARREVVPPCDDERVVADLARVLGITIPPDFASARR